MRSIFHVEIDFVLYAMAVQVLKANQYTIGTAINIEIRIFNNNNNNNNNEFIKLKVKYFWRYMKIFMKYFGQLKTSYE